MALLRKSKELKALTRETKEVGPKNFRQLLLMRRETERLIRDMNGCLKEARSIWTLQRRQYRHLFNDLKAGNVLVKTLNELETEMGAAVRARDEAREKEARQRIRRRDKDAVLLMELFDRRTRKTREVRERIAGIRKKLRKMGKD